MADTEIGWTHPPGTVRGRVWNPSTGCDQVSPGCGMPLPGVDPGDPHGTCYALTLAARLKGMGAKAYQVDGDPRTSGPGFALQMHPDRLDQPLHWAQPSGVFINSMSDLLHPKVTDEFVAECLAVVALTPWHTYQWLTKRSPRLRSLLNRPGFEVAVNQAVLRRDRHAAPVLWPLPNLWAGVSVESQEQAERRLPDLYATPAAVRWVSAEPLLEPVNLWQWIQHDDPDAECSACGNEVWAADTEGHPVQHLCTVACGPEGCGNEGGDEGTWCDGKPVPYPTLDWVVVGGESGPGFRPLNLDWARSLRDQCQAAGVAFFYKQEGGRTPKARGRLLDGREWNQYPTRRTG